MGAPEKKPFGERMRDQCTGFGNFLYRKNDKGETLVMGRTKNSWGKIGLFYLIFYAFLTGFFVAMLSVFLSTLEKPEDGGRPKLTQFIKNRPGLTRVDEKKGKGLFDDDEIPFSNSPTAKTNKDYTDRINSFLAVYDDASIYSNMTCNKANSNGTAKGEKPCKYDYMSELGDCNNSNNTAYGFTEKKPCFFVKMNKVFDWVPDDEGSGYLKLKCDDSSAKVFPEGFLLAAFPFRGQKGFQLPVVAVQIDLTKEKKKTVICELEGENIKVSDTAVASRAYGKIRFEDISFKE